MTRKDFLPLLSGAGGILLGGKARAIPAPAVARPNILLVMDDQHRPGWLGRLGRVPVRTPHLDRLAEKGIHLPNTYCAAPVCGPSRASLALGVEYDACGVPNHQADMDAARPTYYQLLRSSGYYAVGCGKFDLAKHSKSWELDGRRRMAAWGFDDGFDSAGKWDAVTTGTTRPKDPYMAFLHERGLAATHAKDFHRRGKYKGTGPTPLPDDAYNDNWIGRHARSLLQKMPRARPWHLVVNFSGPHEPMDVTASMHRRYRAPPAEFPPPVGRAPQDERHYQEICRNYAAMIENIDAWTGRLLDAIAARGENDRTLVIFCSDHGELLGDFGLWEKQRPYENSVRVPLIIAGPGVRANRTDHALVSLIDVGATILDHAGAPQAPGMTSRSLRPLLEHGARKHRKFVRSGLGPWRMVRDERYKLIVGYRPQMTNRDLMAGDTPRPAPDKSPVLLFDLREDPNELHNIAAQCPGRVRRLTEIV